jgi:hypothetical protein
VRLGRAVTEPFCGSYGEALDGDLLMPVTLAVKEQPYRPGQLPGVPVEAQFPGLADGREQRLALRGKPGQRLVRAVKGL